MVAFHKKYGNVRLGKVLSEELPDLLDIGKRIKRAYPTISY